MATPEPKETAAVDRVLTRKQTAAMLTVCLRTLTTMEAEGRAPRRTQLSDNRFGYRTSAINAFLEKRTEAAA